MQKSRLAVIDAHVHCGEIDRSAPQSLEDYESQAAGAGIEGAAVFSPVMEIYDRYVPDFTDTLAWRQRRKESNAYLLELESDQLSIFPYFFIWNDFAVDQLTAAHCGIKWHRHAGEPVYCYDDPDCQTAFEEIRRRNLPVVLEEELDNTLRFVQDLADGITVIIPHLGLLNGGFQALADEGLWELENVWADTALASLDEMREYLQRYGHDRLLFGSDFPFGSPSNELRKVYRLELDAEAQAAVLGGNFLRLIEQVAVN
jgi:predicted TIM-barrel fold metal-dependent hydrolase